MEVVLYLRYSSDRQTEQSIEGQQRVCVAYCEANDLKIVDTYIDRALSASKDTDKRTEFQRMIRDSEKQQWQGIIVYKLDRFARNRYDSATYKAKLKKNGVRVISATENISDNPEGIILEAVLEGMAEFYSKELSQKITRGMNETALKGLSCGGQLPLGYIINNKKFEIDSATAPAVKKAFELYANGKTVTEISKTLNEQGYRTAKGHAFNKSSFGAMFKNEKYIGVYRYKDILIDGGIPAIVDKQLYESVQRRLKTNSTAPARGKALVDYLLSQKMYCGHCEMPMTGDSATGRHNKKYYYYSCSGRKRMRNCNKKTLSKELIEKIVVEETMTLLNANTIDKIADIAITEANREINQNSIIPSIRDHIKDIEKSIQNLLKLAEQGAVSASIYQRLTKLEEEKEAAATRLQNAEKDIVTLDKDLILMWLNMFLKGDINDIKFRRQIIDMLVNSVFVWDEPDGVKITITYNLTSEPTKTVTVSDLTSQPPPYTLPLQ